MQVLIPVKTVSVANKREHWSARAKRARLHRQSAHWSLEQLKGRPPLPCTVRLTRIAPRELDGDNLQSSLKAVRDGVADWFGLDDRDSRIEWSYAQRKGPPKEYAVLVEVIA